MNKSIKPVPDDTARGADGKPAEGEPEEKKYLFEIVRNKPIGKTVEDNLGNEIVQLMMIDPIEVATQIETVLQGVLATYKEGIYVGSGREPLFIPGHAYFRRQKNNGDLIPIKNSTELLGDIYNNDGEFIARIYPGTRMDTHPLVPVRGLQIVTAFVEHVLHSCSVWSRNTPKFSEMITPMFRPGVIVDDRILVTLDGILIYLSNQVRQFVGNDKWIMHFVREMGTDIVVEKSIDYRIHYFNEKVKAGEWM